MEHKLEQLRDAADLSKEASRHWRRVRTGFPVGKTREPTFVAGDFQIVAVLRLLTNKCGLPVTSFGTVSYSSFAMKRLGRIWGSFCWLSTSVNRLVQPNARLNG